jgi:predicted nucleotide-binding protein (sugar kinase/HSP70/actin superfamily)
MEDINLLLNYIENEIKSKKIFALDKNAILSYTERIRASLPEALNEKRIREETQKAQNIVALAEKRREQMLSETEVVKEAERRAEEIVQKAYEIQTEYATNTMKNLYKMLSDVNEHLQVAKDSILTAMKKLSSEQEE